MIVPSLVDTWSSSHTQIFLGTVWHPRHLRQLNRELHDHFRKFILLKEFLIVPSHHTPVYCLDHHEPSCGMSNKEHFQAKANLSMPFHPLPPTHSPSRTPTELWQWSPSTRQGAGRGCTNAKCLWKLRWTWHGAQQPWKRLYQSLFLVNLHHIRTGSSKTHVKTL